MVQVQAAPGRRTRLPVCHAQQHGLSVHRCGRCGKSRSHLVSLEPHDHRGEPRRRHQKASSSMLNDRGGGPARFIGKAATERFRSAPPRGANQVHRGPGRASPERVVPGRISSRACLPKSPGSDSMSGTCGIDAHATGRPVRFHAKGVSRAQTGSPVLAAPPWVHAVPMRL